jgi:hypothetical protein
MMFVKYAAMFGAAALLAGLLTATVLFANVARNCNRSDFNSGRFLAYCENLKFGDYEHGAFYYDLEPEAVENMKKADVIFLGNSRTLFAFSGDAIANFFVKRKLRYFVLAFGSGETSKFAQIIIQRYNLHPKAIIINSDPFFSNVLGDGSGGPAMEMFGSRAPITRGKYVLKKFALEITNLACKAVPSECKPVSIGLYRNRSDGRWAIDSYRADKSIPFTIDSTFNAKSYAKLNTGEKLDALIGAGKAFLSEVPISPNCIVLTGVPQPHYDNAGLTQALAQALGTKFLNVSVANLATVDGLHLTKDSANRWSNKFFGQLGQRLIGVSPACF